VPRVNHYEVTVTVRMKVTGPLTYSDAVGLAVKSVQLVPAQADLAGRVSEMEIEGVGIDGSYHPVSSR
jgi:hypothetical protein